MNRYFAIFLFSIFHLAGCDSSYKGDGKLSDAGYFAAKDRYVLNLGDINLWKNEEYQFNIINLPDENFVLGFRASNQSITANDPSQDIRDKVNIKIVVTDQGGFEVINESALIEDWVWSHARGSHYIFGYHRCDEEADHTGYFTCVEGTGTYFTPSEGKQYSVKLIVSGEERIGSELIGTLLVKSGGWK
jgi:hypothetical protein